MNQSKLFATGMNEPEPAQPTADERARQKADILQALRWAGSDGVTTLRMLEICAASYRQRISDLRKEGHQIDCRKLGDSNVYVLEGE